MTSYSTEVTTITGDYTLVFRDRYLYADTFAGGYKTHLPQRPLVGERHTIKDLRLTFFTGNLTVDGNGHVLEQLSTAGFAPAIAMKSNGQSATWEYGFDGRWHLVEFYEP